MSAVLSQALLKWYEDHGRKNLPWQVPGDPYRTWLSEVMLQQTQVKTVIPYFMRFLAEFPDIFALANAHEDVVLSQWAGLGYYSRARNLHQAAKIICSEHQGQFPETVEALERLPGIGQSTAAAIVSQAFNRKAAILDGNVKRVLSRYFRVEGSPEKAATQTQLWALAEACLPEKDFAKYTQAIMDLGALCCTRSKPNCDHCPLSAHCQAFKDQVVHCYPQKKQKKERPLKSAQCLLIHSADKKLLLEKRPKEGIWGGLWALPMMETSDCPIEFIKNQFQAESMQVQELLKMRHSFTHFHLDIIAQQIQLDPAKTQIHQHQQWLSKEEIQSLGLPAPVQKIVEHWFLNLCCEAL